MSYYDPDQLPFVVSPSDAQGMGISPFDNQFTAVEKFNTDLVRQGMEFNANFMREMDAALQSGTSTAGVAGVHGAGHYVPGQLSQLLRQLGPGRSRIQKAWCRLLKKSAANWKGRGYRKPAA